MTEKGRERASDRKRARQRKRKRHRCSGDIDGKRHILEESERQRMRERDRRIDRQKKEERASDRKRARQRKRTNTSHKCSGEIDRERHMEESKRYRQREKQKI